MYIDDATWKRVTKRLALVEQALENVNDWNVGVYEALRTLARRHGATCGADPMCQLMLGPGSKPRVLPVGIGEPPGVYKIALQMLTPEEVAELFRRQGVLLELRLMLEERLAKKGKQSPKSPPSGGGMLGL